LRFLFIVVAFALGSFALWPGAQAVTPAPDGGYPGANTAEGQNAFLSLTTGTYNTAVGIFSLKGDTIGSFNTAVGAGALVANTADQNTATGFGALLSTTTGSYNTANGTFALFSNTTRIGRFQIATYIAGIAGQTVGAGGTTYYVDNDGKLGVFLSARRFKTDIADMGAASEALLALRPVTFHYKKGIDPQGISQFRLVAEDVEGVNPDLVVRDKEGKVNTVRYDAVNAMLLNEFLKEHRKVQELEANAAEQQKEIKALAATVKEQAEQIQKVSAQFEASKPAPQMALNNP
jgi:hypothetical protein